MNAKYIVIKTLLEENKTLRQRCKSFESKPESTESSLNQLEQYGRGNNNAISGIPDNNTDDKLEDVVMKILADVDVIVEASDIEARHRFSKSDRKTTGKEKIIRFPNRKNCEKGIGTFSVGTTTCF